MREAASQTRQAAEQGDLDAFNAADAAFHVGMTAQQFQREIWRRVVPGDNADS